MVISVGAYFTVAEFLGWPDVRFDIKLWDSFALLSLLDIDYSFSIGMPCSVSCSESCFIDPFATYLDFKVTNLSFRPL